MSSRRLAVKLVLPPPLTQVAVNAVVDVTGKDEEEEEVEDEHSGASRE